MLELAEETLATAVGASSKSRGTCQSFLTAAASGITEKIFSVVSFIFFPGGSCGSDAVIAVAVAM